MLVWCNFELLLYYVYSMWNMYNVAILHLGSDVVTPKNETPNSAQKGVAVISEVLEMPYMNSSSCDKQSGELKHSFKGSVVAAVMLQSEQSTGG